MAPTTRSQPTSSSSPPTPITPITPSSNLPPTAKPVSVLFICLGNICRSPLAEAVFHALTAYSTSSQHPLISRIDSCGTGAYHTNAPPDSRTLAVLKSRAGITDYTHRARRIRIPDDVLEFDYLVVMDGDNLDDVRDMVRRAERKGSLGKEEYGKRGRVCLFGEFGGREGGREEVGDPYYGGGEGFEIAFEQVGRMGRRLLGHIEEQAMKGAEGRE